MAASTAITSPFYTTGFQLTTSNAEGRFLKIRRTAHSDYVTWGYPMGKVMVYQSQDLLVVLGDSVSITPDTVASLAPWSATNLIINAGTRRASSDWDPMIDILQTFDSSIISCYFTEQESWPDNNTFVMGVDLGGSFFIHAILLVTDLLKSNKNAFSTILSDTHADSYAGDISPFNKHKFQRFEVYIGDSPNYLLNEKLEGGPWLNDPSDPNDPDYTKIKSDGIGGTTHNMWAWGKELWVNM